MEKILEKVSSAVSKQVSLQQLCEIIVREFCLFAGWPYGEAWLPDNEGTQLKLSASWSEHKNIFSEFTNFSSICKFAKGIGFVGKVWEKQEAKLDDELSITSDFLRYDISKRTGIVAGFGFFVNINNVPCVLTFFTLKNMPDNKEKIAALSSAVQEIEKIIQYR